MSAQPGLLSETNIAHPRRPATIAPRGRGLLLSVLGFGLGVLAVLAWTVHGRDLHLFYQSVEEAILAESGSPPKVPAQADRTGPEALTEPNGDFEDPDLGAAPLLEAKGHVVGGDSLGSRDAPRLAALDPAESGDDAALRSAGTVAGEREVVPDDGGIAAEPASLEPSDLEEEQESILEATAIDDVVEIVPRVRAAVIGTDGAAVISGIAPPGSAWIIWHNDNPIGVVTANGSGTWKHFPEAPLLGEDHRFELLPATHQADFAEPFL